jgi:hypothetical protein
VPRAGAGRATPAGARAGDDWAQAELVSPRVPMARSMKSPGYSYLSGLSASCYSPRRPTVLGAVGSSRSESKHWSLSTPARHPFQPTSSYAGALSRLPA